MNAMAKAETLAPSAQESTAMDRLIERAVSDPTFDVEKLERLFALAERTRSAQSEQAYNSAMSLAQAEMRPISADAENPQTHSKYATYAALDQAIRPIYTRHGLSLSFYQGEGAPTDYVRVCCKVSLGAHSERPHIDMPADGKGAKGGDVMTKTHATGAAFSYGQRYLLKMIFNIAVGEDKDGNRPIETISQDQLGELQELMDSTDADRAKFLNYFRIKGLTDLPAKNFDRAVAMLQAKASK